MGGHAVDSQRLERFNRHKRLIDLAACLLILPIALPLGTVVFLALLQQQGRPVFYRQERLGYREQVFRIYKFRTMSDARDESGNLLPDAERLTRIGRVLRKTSLDELPQLINILRGDMSFIGPRPLFPRYLPYYTERERIRHMVRPGVTGFAQVNGRNLVGWNARLEMDAQYVERASHLLDIVIALKTAKRILLRTDIAVIPGTLLRPLDIERSQCEYRDDSSPE